jgi:hypothetical protein
LWCGGSEDSEVVALASRREPYGDRLSVTARAVRCLVSKFGGYDRRARALPLLFAYLLVR